MNFRTGNAPAVIAARTNRIVQIDKSGPQFNGCEWMGIAEQVITRGRPSRQCLCENIFDKPVKAAPVARGHRDFIEITRFQMMAADA